MKIIAILPVRNESWIIRHNLNILVEICDEILVTDGDSTDGTREICSSFEKVQSKAKEFFPKKFINLLNCEFDNIGLFKT